jgi:hypothetical protein
MPRSLFRRVYKKPEDVVFVRHRRSCTAAHHGAFHRSCNCPKWLRYSLDGKQHRVPAETGSWSVAEQRRAEREEQLKADTVAPGDPRPSNAEADRASTERFSRLAD